MERFSCDTKIISGSGSVAALGELGFRRVLVVADPFFSQNGTAKKLAELTGAACTEIFSEVEPDPSVTLVAKGTAALRSFRPDGVVALGGGSAMDLAKAMLYFSGSDAVLVAVPTTSGSGSEVTDFAVLTHDGVKHPLVDARLRPQFAVLDSNLVETMPAKLAADTGFDVLCHAMEAYTGKHVGQFSSVLAREAFATVYALPPKFP